MATPAPPSTPVLEGRFVRLEPVTDAAFAELAPVLRTPEVFASGYGGGLAGLPANDDDFVPFMRNYTPASRGGHTWVVRLVGGLDAGAAVGTTSLGNLVLEWETAEIGWTAYEPAVWGTVVNVETKLLMFQNAFDWGFNRVVLNADAINARSRAAISKLGAHLDGVLRRHRPRPDGTWRDTATFSVLVDEWPRVRAGLEARIDAWGAAAVHR